MQVITIWGPVPEQRENRRLLASQRDATSLLVSRHPSDSKDARTGRIPEALNRSDPVLGTLFLMSSAHQFGSGGLLALLVRSPLLRLRIALDRFISEYPRLHSELLAKIEELHRKTQFRQDDAPVFDTRNFRKEFQKACVAAGLGKITKMVSAKG
jgi:hypothetical protein